MGFHITPATPGTLVVLAATVLLVLVTVSTPLLKSIYFLKASIDVSVGSTDVSGEVTLGTFGYCVDSTCTDPKLGYSLDIASLLDINGSLSGISNSVLKWITYLLILHPIAAAFGVISTIFGGLAHMHGFAGTALTTCFASFAATFALLAFIFDIVVFVIAKKRIESSDVGGSAELGSACWMTLAAMIMYALSGCFFGCGACIIRKRRGEREASEKNRPVVDEEYGSKMRAEAFATHEVDKQHRKEGTLPNFAEHERSNEQIPLNSMHDQDDYDDGRTGTQYQPVRFASSTDVGAPSIISGVGEGYGRRDPRTPGVPISMTADSLATGNSAPAQALAVGGVGSRLGAQARADRGRATSTDQERLNAPARQGSSSTTEPFTGMYGHPQDQPSQGYTDPYAADPYAQSTSPAPAGAYNSMPVPRIASPPQSPIYGGSQQQHLSPSYGGAYPPYPTAASPSAYSPQPLEKAHYAQPGSAMPMPQSQPSAQRFHVQNPSDYPSSASHYGSGNAGETGSLAPTYYTHDQQAHSGYAQQAYGAGGVSPVYEAAPSAVTYNQQGSSADNYGAPHGYEGARRY
ncbi:hypothetical protein JCM10207_008524 [Rhodosporidiobolus poonsookiae]